jgi:phosphatidylglycerophosphatase A
MGAYDFVPPPGSLPKRADWRFMRGRLSRWIAMGFGSGLAPFAPGTVGTLWGWIVFLLLDSWLTPLGWLVTLLVTFVAGTWACSRTGRDLGVSDHGAMVIDEILAIWIVFLIIPNTFWWQFMGFVVFRFFDAVKPQPVRWADQRFKGGFGVMFDDIIAALMTLFFLALFFSPWISRIFV